MPFLSTLIMHLTNFAPRNEKNLYRLPSMVFDSSAFGMLGLLRSVFCSIIGFDDLSAKDLVRTSTTWSFTTKEAFDLLCSASILKWIRNLDFFWSGYSSRRQLSILNCSKKKLTFSPSVYVCVGRFLDVTAKPLLPMRSPSCSCTSYVGSNLHNWVWMMVIFRWRLVRHHLQPFPCALKQTK